MEIVKSPFETNTYHYENKRNTKIKGNGRFHKPKALQTPTLSVLLVFTLILIALVEIACRRLPNAPSRGVVTTISEGLSNIQARQETNVNETTTIDTGVSSPEAPGGDPTTGTPMTPVDTPAISTCSMLGDMITGTTTITVDGTLSQLIETSTCSSTMIVSDAFKCDASSTCQGYAPNTASVNVWLKTGPRTVPISQPNAKTTPNPKQNQNPTPTPSSNGNAVQPVNGNVVQPVNGNVVQPFNGNAIQPTNGAASPNPATPQAIANNGQPAATNAPVVNGSPTSLSNGVSPASRINPGVADSTDPAAILSSNPQVTAVNGQLVPTTTPIVIGSPIMTTNIGTSTSSAGSRPLGNSPFDATNSKIDPAEDSEDSEALYSSVYVFTNAEYFVGAFLPTILAIIFTIPWGILDTAAKAIEPYVQLASSKSPGASARDSLSLDYNSALFYLVPFKAIRRGHFIVFISSFLNVISLATAPLASESMFIALKGTCNAQTDQIYCLPELSVFRIAAHALEAVLGLMAIFLILLIIFNRRRDTGVYADPYSLAATATLFHSPRLVEKFKSLPPGVEEKTLVKLLQGHTYGLGYYCTGSHDGSMSYGFVLDPQGNDPQGGVAEYRNVYVSDDQYLEKPSKPLWRKKMRRFLQIIAFATCLIALLGVLVFYKYGTWNTPIDAWMNSQAFGVRLSFTTFGVIITLFWNYIRDVIHTNEPYHNLNAGGVSARDSILITPSPIPITGIFRSLRRHAFFLVSVDLCTILCELLTVVLPNVPYSSGTTYKAFNICFFISISILTYMLLILLVLLIRIGRLGGGNGIPRTLAGKMRLLIGSHIVAGFGDLGDISQQQRDETIEGLGKTYSIGKMMADDGVVRRTVDFEEFVEKN